MKEKKFKNFLGKVKGPEKKPELDYYKINYNPAEKKFFRVDIKATSVKIARNRQTQLEYPKVFTNKGIVDGEIELLNNDIVNRFTEISNPTDLVIRKCRVCGKYFIFTHNEFEWYMEHDLFLPCKCKPCRKAAKAKKAESKNKEENNDKTDSSK